jgi:hypothetical protein
MKLRTFADRMSAYDVKFGGNLAAPFLQAVRNRFSDSADRGLEQTCANPMEPLALPVSGQLSLEEGAEHLGPAILKVAFPLKSAVQKSLDSLLRFGPRQRDLKGVERIEEPVGGWQRDLVDEVLARRNSTPVEGGDPARERVDESVQLRIRKRPIDVSVSLGRVTVEVARAEDDFEGAATADQMGKALGTATAGMHANADFGLAQSRVLARREAHVAGENELAAYAPDAASNLRC